MTEASLENDRAEPLGWQDVPAAVPEPLAAFGPMRCRRFELSSRGDRVGGRLLLPAGEDEGPFPLVLLQHGAGGSMDAPYVFQSAGPWVRGGAAVASIDFPLHGERANPKLSARLLAALADATAVEAGHGDPHGLLLWREFVAQSLADLARALDGLTALPTVDADRVAYAGFSLGAILGANLCGLDPRPRAAALALAGGGFGPSETDPCRRIAAFAGRPLLLVGAERDERIPRAATEALFAAAGEPKRLVWFDCTHAGLPGRGLKAMWEFLRPELALPPAA